MDSGPKRRTTSPGLGAAKRAEKITLREEDAPPQSRQNIDCPPPSGPPKRSSRPAPLRVDDVGNAAMKIASRTRRSGAPRLVTARPDARSAPLDPPSAYVLSLVDGVLTVEGLADATGIAEEEVGRIVERLVRLGFVTRP